MIVLRGVTYMYFQNVTNYCLKMFNSNVTKAEGVKRDAASVSYVVRMTASLKLDHTMAQTVNH